MGLVKGFRAASFSLVYVSFYIIQQQAAGPGTGVCQSSAHPETMRSFGHTNVNSPDMGAGHVGAFTRSDRPSSRCLPRPFPGSSSIRPLSVSLSHTDGTPFSPSDKAI